MTENIEQEAGPGAEITDAEVVAEFNPADHEFVEVDDAGEIRIRVPLLRPFEDLAGEPVREVVMKEPTLGHMRVMDTVKGQVGKITVLIATLADMPAKVAERIKTKDLGRIQDALDPFLPEGAIGEEE